METQSSIMAYAMKIHLSAPSTEVLSSRRRRSRLRETELLTAAIPVNPNPRTAIDRTDFGTGRRRKIKCDKVMMLPDLSSLGHSAEYDRSTLSAAIVPKVATIVPTIQTPVLNSCRTLS